jgi:hypothetical protein
LTKIANDQERILNSKMEAAKAWAAPAFVPDGFHKGVYFS